ncbi:MAG: acyl carrier protein [Eggerthellaceae bacterium]|nr:acyl carrier protein [Eggerthellaceae bacterium]
MENTEIYEKLDDIFQDVFDDETIKLEPSTSSADIEEWDSLAQISIIVAVQDEFGITMNVNEATNLHNVGEMVDLIKEKMQ